MANTSKGALIFNGNCKSSRIKAACLISEPNTPISTKVLFSIKGLIPDRVSIIRYKSKIINSCSSKVKVS